MAAPNKLTPEVRVKLEEAAALDCTQEEMALYAGVVRQTLASWLKEDEKLSNRITELRNTPVLKARQVINDRMSESYANAVDYLKRKKKDEFGDNSEVTVKTPQPLLNALLNNNGDEKDSKTG